MAIEKKNALKTEFLEIVKDSDLNDMKEIVAEICEQYAELGSELDVLDMTLTKFKLSNFLNSLAQLALTEILIEKNIISRKGLKARMLKLPGKKTLEEYLGLNLSTRKMN